MKQELESAPDDGDGGERLIGIVVSIIVTVDRLILVVAVLVVLVVSIPY